MCYPAVSIIIPVYNASKHIVRALDSIKNQTYKNYEVIVIDDGSTDDSSTIIENHGIDLKLIKQTNGGASSARNVGIKAATGKYIAFLDSDDEWLPSKLLVQITQIEKNNALIAVYCRDYNLREVSNIDSSSLPALINKNCEEIFRQPYNLTTSSFLIKTIVIRELGGFDENLQTAEDIDLYLKASLYGEIGELSESLCVKHDVENSLGSALSSYQDNLDVVTSFYNSNVDQLPASFEKSYINMKVYVLNSWCEDLLWKNKFSNSLDVCFRSLCVKLSIRAIHLLCKIVIKSSIVFVRSQ
jgi:glycosyltransferase involved in cell wall biosynthesis